MEKTLLGAMCSILLLLPTHASVNRPLTPLNKKFAGTFLKKKTIYFANYINSDSCEDDGGVYQDGYCIFDSADELKVKEVKKDLFEIEVSTIGTNGHSCLFIAEATPISKNTLLASVAAEDYNEDSQRWEETTCQVTVTYSGDFVSVDNNGKCREFCGARSQLAIDKALRR